MSVPRLRAESSPRPIRSSDLCSVIAPGPDGTQFAFLGFPSGTKPYQSGIYLAAFRGTQVREFLPKPPRIPPGPPGWTPTLDWSPDGQTLLLSAAGEISLIDVHSGQTKKLTAGSGALWSPAGCWISVICARARGRAVRRRDPATPPHRFAAQDWGPYDGRMVARRQVLAGSGDRGHARPLRLLVGLPGSGRSLHSARRR